MYAAWWTPLVSRPGIFIRRSPPSSTVIPNLSHTSWKTIVAFEGINFAAKITHPIVVNAGLGDDICPPETDDAVLKASAMRASHPVWR
jgi:cephalosporin-C deacetylase-like acetyl esterase